MANILLQDLAQYLQENALGTRNTDLFLGGSPDDPSLPDLVTILSEYGGQQSRNRVKDAARNVQVLVRSNPRDYESGHRKVWAIYNLLADPAKRFLRYTNGREVNIGEMKQTPGKLQEDDLHRPIFVFNFSVWTTPD